MGDFITGWPPFLLLLALLIGMLAAHTMFKFIGNLKRDSNSYRQFWLAGGAFVFGGGLWVNQFLVMLTYDRPLYFSWTMLVSLFFSIFFTLTGFVMFTFQGVFRHRLLLGSSIMAFGIGFMAYFSLLGQPIDRLTLYPEIFTLSLVILLIGTYISFLLSEHHSPRMRRSAGFVLGMVIMLVQHLSIFALETEYSALPERVNRDINLLGMVIGISTLMILASTLVTWYIDKRLNQMDERYRLLVENSLDTIAIVKKGRWTYINSSGLRMFEAEKPEDMLGKPIYAFLPPDEHQDVKERLQNLVVVGSGSPVEQIWYTLKGKVLHTEIVETMTTLDNEPAVQLIIRDISERKKNEELLINSEKLYVAGQLAAGIAHEIRNPLTSLKGFLQLIASGRKTSANYYEIMNSELDRIEEIVSELLMLSKPQVYQLSYNDVRNMMRDTVTLLETQAILRNIAIETDYGPEPLWVFGVENQVKQVFINVIKNAIEAMEDGGCIRINLSRENDGVFIRIHDEGPGIGEDQLAKIGQPFYTTKEKGTGLGLMVSYKIVDNHHGRIQVKSEVGKGTVFEIMLPFRYPAPEAKISS